MSKVSKSKVMKGLALVGAGAGVLVAGRRFLAAWDKWNVEGDSVSGTEAMQFGVALIFAVSAFVATVKAVG